MRTGIVLSILLVGIWVMPARAGWQEGREALDRGDHVTALTEIRPVAEQGNREAQALLGYLYERGVKGIPQNYPEAYKWYSLAAEKGDAQSQVALGRMYWEGKGLPQDYQAAMRMFELAAAQGSSAGQTNIGTMYLNGYGVEKNMEAAMKWFRLAADQGDGLAQLQLGQMYYEGTGVPQDLVQAHMWYSLAATKGAKGASFLRDYMTSSMTPTQIAQARKLAHDWSPKVSD